MDHQWNGKSETLPGRQLIPVKRQERKPFGMEYHTTLKCSLVMSATFVEIENNRDAR